jgi:hypothetical protein
MSKEQALNDYIMVNERIMEFYSKYPEGRIETEIVSNDSGQIVFKAYVFKRFEDSIPSATGHAMEKEGNSFINKNSHVENCETSAVGRALAMLGLSIKKSIASYEEVANAKLQQEGSKGQEDMDAMKQIKELYIEMKGTVTGFKEFLDTMKDKGHTLLTLRELMLKKRGQKNE